MKVIIAEKPSLARTIAEALGAVRTDNGVIYLKNGDAVTSAFGHLLEAAPPDHYDQNLKFWSLDTLPIVPDRFEKIPKDKDSAARIKLIGGLLKKASGVVNAGDPDREGQLIVDEILEYLGYDGPVERVWLQDLTATGIRKAFAKIEPNSKYASLTASAKAREQADWLVGMNLTRAWTLKAGGKGNVLSVGRVQTPTLALIVERHKQRQGHKKQLHYGVRIGCDAGQPELLHAEWVIPNDLKTDGLLLDQAVAEKVQEEVSGKPALVKKVQVQKKKEESPLPFTLSELQKQASAKYGMGAKKVLDIAQALYEKHKATTYPRTDCGYLADAQHAEAPQILSALAQIPAVGGIAANADTSRKHRAFDDAKIDAHTGIIPTGVIPKNLTPDEEKIFVMIALRYIALFYPLHEYDAVKATLEAGGHAFEAKWRNVTANGWKDILGAPPASRPTPPESASLPIREAEVISKETKPPAPFTEGTLIDAMRNIARYVSDSEAKKRLKENEGIGTEATRAAIIEGLKKRGYIKEVKKGKKTILEPTEKGIQFIEALKGQIKDPITTAQWESTLSRVEAGELSAEEFVRGQLDYIRKELEAVNQVQTQIAGGGQKNEPIGKCPLCGKPVVENSKAYGCSGWREGCKFTIWKNSNGGRITKKIAKEIIEKGISGPVKLKNKAGKEYTAPLRFDREQGRVVPVFD